MSTFHVHHQNTRACVLLSRNIALGSVLIVGVWCWSQVGDTLLTPNDDIRMVALSSSGSLLAVVQRTRMTVWDSQSGTLIGTVDQTLNNHGPIIALWFDTEEDNIRFATMDGTVAMWSKTSKTLSHSFIALPPPVRQPSREIVTVVAVASDHTLLASGTESGKIFVFDLQTGNLLKAFAPDRGGIRSLSFNSDSTLLASGDSKDTITLWDLLNGAAPRMMKRDSGQMGGGYVYSVSFSPDDKVVASSGFYGGITLWEVKTGAKLRALGSDAEWIEKLDFVTNHLLISSSRYREPGEEQGVPPLHRRVVFWSPSRGRTCELPGFPVSIQKSGTLVAVADKSTVAIWKISDTIRPASRDGCQGLRSVSKVNVSSPATSESSNESQPAPSSTISFWIKLPVANPELAGYLAVLGEGARTILKEEGKFPFGYVSRKRNTTAEAVAIPVLSPLMPAVKEELSYLLLRDTVLRVEITKAAATSIEGHSQGPSHAEQIVMEGSPLNDFDDFRSPYHLEYDLSDGSLTLIASLLPLHPTRQDSMQLSNVEQLLGSKVSFSCQNRARELSDETRKKLDALERQLEITTVVIRVSGHDIWLRKPMFRLSETDSAIPVFTSLLPNSLAELDALRDWK